MANVFIYQILNHYTAADALDPGFLVLDNSSNENLTGMSIGRSGNSY